jgi:hypothetical protein
MGNPGRNSPCPCGSGKKYKRCCGREGDKTAGSESPPGRFRFEPGSYGGPGRSYAPSILCYEKIAPDSWTEHFCLVNPNAAFEDDDKALDLAKQHLAAAFSLLSGGGAPGDVALYLRREGYKRIDDFRIAKDEPSEGPGYGRQRERHLRSPLPGETADPVDFITTELGKDLIVSFAIRSNAVDGDVLSLTLSRTPEYEFILDESERGVHVSNERDDNEFEFLKELKISGRTAVLKTTRNCYVLDLRDVEKVGMDEMNSVLEAMNFDGRFLLTIG